MTGVGRTGHLCNGHQTRAEGLFSSGVHVNIQQKTILHNALAKTRGFSVCSRHKVTCNVIFQNMTENKSKSVLYQECFVASTVSYFCMLYLGKSTNFNHNVADHDAGIWTNNIK
jgi:hypothetical protein